MFDDLVFIEDYSGIKRSRMTIGKYVLSVILEPRKSLYEIAVLDEYDNFVNLPGITNDDVVPYLTEDDVSIIMKKLMCLVGISA